MQTILAPSDLPSSVSELLPVTDQCPDSEPWCDEIAAAIMGPGYVVLPNAIDRALIQALQQRLGDGTAGFRDAAIGRGRQQQQNKAIRSDKIHWLSAAEQPDQRWLQQMDTLRQGLNQRLFMGLFDYECHYAWYQPGSFYRQHLDALPGSRNRILTTVLFLNDDWQAADGGELLIYDERQQLLQTVLPEAGTLVIFLSEQFPHEVLPTRRGRGSIAGWFRVSNSHYGF